MTAESKIQLTENPCQENLNTFLFVDLTLSRKTESYFSCENIHLVLNMFVNGKTDLLT